MDIVGNFSFLNFLPIFFGIGDNRDDVVKPSSEEKWKPYERFIREERIFG